MLRYLFAAVLVGVAPPLLAQTGDPLWDKVVTQLDGAHRWAADAIDLASDLDTGSEVKHVFTAIRVSGWKEGEPVYVVVKTQPPDKGPHKDFNFLNGLTSLAGALTEGDPPHRIDGQSLGGIASTVFETHFDKALQTGAVKLWVDPVSGTPRQMVVAMHMPLVLDATVTTRYGAGPEGHAMPANVEYALDVLIPFKKSRAHIRQSITSWVARPAAVARD